MDVLFGYVLKPFLLPPGVNIVLAVSGLALRRRRPRLGGALVGLALASLWFLATANGAGLLAATLESSPPLTPEAARAAKARAIVVLGGAAYPNAREYGAPTIGAETLVRVRYAALLHHELDLPVATLGGDPFGAGPPVGVTMAQALHDEFGVTVQWIETESRNTAENAANARSLLAEAPRILLVTHAMHMPRAKHMFELAGFEVVPAPTGFASSGSFGFDLDVFSFLPSAGYLATSRDALHEWLGLLWYRLRYRQLDART